MAFWNRFPYSNFHEINLDWIIREMKKISGSVSDFARQWEKALKQETGERQEADRQLQENIEAEQDRAEAAEEAIYIDTGSQRNIISPGYNNALLTLFSVCSVSLVLIVCQRIRAPPRLFPLYTRYPDLHCDGCMHALRFMPVLLA